MNIELLSPFYRCENSGTEIVNSLAKSHRARNYRKKDSSPDVYFSVPSMVLKYLNMFVE